jgi:ribonuclease P protein component
MLEKKYRITKNKEFESVMTQKEAVYSPVLMIKFVKNELSYPRIGLIVSNKVSKKASQRNLIKRRIREIIQLNFKKIKKNNDIIIIVSPKIIKEAKVLKYQEIETYLITAFKKAKLI